MLSSLLMVSNAWGEIKTGMLEYSVNGTKMEGFVAYDDAIKTPRPGILIVHDWMGLGPFTKNKAEMLAKLGYVAFAVDVYGKGVHPKDTKEASKLANEYKENRQLLRSRMRAAFDKLITFKEVNPKKVLVMGYCFGGMAALELARSGAPVVGTVSFHGVLSSPTPKDAMNIKGSVLILHGSDDPNVPPAEVEAFKDEMKKAAVDMEFFAYPGAVHAFTNPDAGNDKSKGVAYNADADKHSWEEFQRFLKRVF